MDEPPKKKIQDVLTDYANSSKEMCLVIVEVLNMMTAINEKITSIEEQMHKRKRE